MRRYATVCVLVLIAVTQLQGIAALRPTMWPAGGVLFIQEGNALRIECWGQDRIKFSTQRTTACSPYAVCIATTRLSTRFSHLPACFLFFCTEKSLQFVKYRRIPRSQNYSRGCILPEQPIGGRFEVESCSGTSCDVTPGLSVVGGTFLAFICDEGYALNGYKFTGCLRDEWYLLPTCVKTCPRLKSQSVDIVYEYQSDGPFRNSTIYPGTNATLNCKRFYELHDAYEPGYRKIRCLDGGMWNRPLFDCTSECGKSSQAVPYIVHGSIAQHAEFPWHVGIYKKKRYNHLEQICGGTLVRPDLVVSAAHCFYNEIQMKVINASKFAVAAGKMNRSYNESEPQAQTSFVKNIYIDDKYYDRAGNYALDIALIRTKMSFVYTVFVRPICIDVENKHEGSYLWPGRKGKVAGWGITEDNESSVELRKMTLPYIPHQECIDAVPPEFGSFVSVDDKFCAGYLNGSSICKGDSGGGLCYNSNGLWYLRGIVSVGPDPQSTDVSCESNYYTVFTNVSKHMEWIRGFLTSSESEPRMSCALPEKPLNGNFGLESNPESMHVALGGEVPNGGSLIYSCDKGYTLNGSNISRCNEGAWSIPPPICARKCRPLKVSKIVNVVCKFENNTVPCESEMDAGTEATVTCPGFYKILGDPTSTNRGIFCNEEGEWDRPVAECVPECGRLVDENRWLWQVSIYFANSSGGAMDTLITDGTLVSPDLVITDTRPFVAIVEDIGIQNFSKYVYVFAEDFETLNNETVFKSQTTFAMSINTTAVFINNSLVTMSGNTRPGYVDPDILLIRLKTPFTMTYWLRPICMDWGNRQLQPEVNRVLVLDTSPPYRDRVRNISLIPTQECPAYNVSRRLHVDSMVKTKYCVAHSSLPGFQGVYGILSEFNGVWYLRGIGEDYDKDQNCDVWTCRHLVTNVTSSIDWIRSVFMESASSALMVNQTP